MAHPVQNGPIKYSIPLKTAVKFDETFEYSATDTIMDLSQWIFDNQGIPFEQQRLYVVYGLSKCWEKRELDANQNELLVDHLQGAQDIALFLKLRQNPQ